MSRLKHPLFFKQGLHRLDRENRALDALLITPQGDWLMVAGKEIRHNDGFASALAAEINAKIAAGHTVLAGDCNELGACAVTFDDWTASTSGVQVPACFARMLGEYKTNRWPIRDVEITDASCAFLSWDGHATYSPNLDRDLVKAIEDRKAGNRTIEALSIGFKHEWALVADHNPMFSGAPLGLRQVLQRTARAKASAGMMTIGAGRDFVWYSWKQHADTATRAAGEIGAIEWELGDGKTNIWRRMNQLGVSGVSIALITKSPSGPVVSLARGYGRRVADRELPVLARTPFSLASMSKFLGALVIARQLELEAKGGGVTEKTDLLATPNILPPAGVLKRWQAIGENPRSAFRDELPDEMGGEDRATRQQLGRITLECVLTHTCGIVSGNDGSSLVRRGLWTANNSRSTLDWLLGRVCDDEACEPFGNPVWQVSVDRHGDTRDYDSADYLVVQGYLEDRTRQTAHAKVAEWLFKPIGMSDSETHVALGAAYEREAAWPHDAPGEPNLVSSAWVFGGGIRASSIDYANAMIVVLNGGKAANGTPVLHDPASVDHFLKKTVADSHGGWGVDFDNTATDITKKGAFFHGGAHPGSRTKMCGNPSRQEGIVILTNLGGDDAQLLINEIEAAYLSKVAWGADCDR